MRYLCTNCSHIYDESIWDTEEWYDAGLKLYDMQDYFVCPVCNEWIDSFQEIIEEINFIELKNDLTGVEDEHCPIITLENWKIKVIVGKEEVHSSMPEHFISNVSLFDEYWDLVEEKFLDSNSDFPVIFDNYDLDEFEIRITCNLHWVWSIGKIKNSEFKI